MQCRRRPVWGVASEPGLGTGRARAWGRLSPGLGPARLNSGRNNSGSWNQFCRAADLPPRLDLVEKYTTRLQGWPRRAWSRATSSHVVLKLAANQLATWNQQPGCHLLLCPHLPPRLSQQSPFSALSVKRRSSGGGGGADKEKWKRSDSDLGHGTAS